MNGELERYYDVGKIGGTARCVDRRLSINKCGYDKYSILRSPVPKISPSVSKGLATGNLNVGINAIVKSSLGYVDFPCLWHNRCIVDLNPVRLH